MAQEIEASSPSTDPSVASWLPWVFFGLIVFYLLLQIVLYRRMATLDAMPPVERAAKQLYGGVGTAPAQLPQV